YSVDKDVAYCFCIRFLLHQGLAFRGRDEENSSKNKGNFRELLQWLAGNFEEVNKVLPHSLELEKVKYLHPNHVRRVNILAEGGKKTPWWNGAKILSSYLFIHINPNLFRFNWLYSNNVFLSCRETHKK
ncbi:hypothetical protein ACJX0J_011856, partial [Zea mays]